MDTHELPKLCDYGCGEPAKFVLNNGKGCCADNPQRCQALRQRAAEKQRGSNNSFYGRKHSEDTRSRMATAKLGDRNNFYGRKHSEDTKAAISKSRCNKCTGEDNHTYGKPRSLSVRHKVSQSRVSLGSARGSKNPNWKGGITKSRKGEMQTTKYKAWRKAVFERDNYTCQICGQRGGDLEADHKVPWAESVELRYEVSNGRTLCVKCHRTTFKKVKSVRKDG